ncbi:zinc-binding dehydrogenase domain-containing protein [Phthorimaea operculella]|nr:zinc-binding dehydrogenase domain-containing protein [Phthorimaea operculella]
MASGDQPSRPQQMTYAESTIPFFGALIDYVNTSYKYLRNKTFAGAEKLHINATRATLSATFMATVCLMLGVVANIKFEVVTLDAEPLTNDLHFMLLSKDENLYIDDVDVSKVMWCIEMSDMVVVLLSCLLIWNSANVSQTKRVSVNQINSLCQNADRRRRVFVKKRIPAGIFLRLTRSERSIQNGEGKEDGEILVKTEWISVDPYQRAYNRRNPTPYDQFGYQVAAVVESKSADYKVGDKVVSHKGWRDYSILNTTPTLDPRQRIYKLPDMQGLSESLGVGAVGMPGVTAYFGFLELCQPKAGETVVVTGAAGAVGSLVGQIAKIKGCKVIGFAGSDAKVQWLQKEIGFDKAFNYKTVNVLQALKEAAPNGVDCFFDNVGGEDSSIILSQMNDYGRIAVCGAISSYNEDPAKMPKCTVIQPALVFRQLKMEGFLVWRWTARWDEALTQLIQWISSGQLKTRETVTEGFDNIFDAFSGMLNGENTGKAVVKV